MRKHYDQGRPQGSKSAYIDTYKLPPKNVVTSAAELWCVSQLVANRANLPWHVATCYDTNKSIFF